MRVAALIALLLHRLWAVSATGTISTRRSFQVDHFSYERKLEAFNRPREVTKSEEEVTGARWEKFHGGWLREASITTENEPSSFSQRSSKIWPQESRGQFTKVDRRLQTDVARSQCLSDASVLESNITSPYTCSCSQSSDNGYRLECEESCGEFCNLEGTVCGKKKQAKTYDISGAVIILDEVFEYTLGNGAEVTVSQRGCQSDGTCDTWIVQLNDNRACNSCSMIVCEEEGGQAPLVDCENIEQGATFDFCSGDFGSTNGVFEFLSASGFDTCIDPTAQAMAGCESDLQYFESSFPDKQYRCSCEENSLGRVTLSCSANCGEFCNANESVCGTQVYDQLYNANGDPFLTADNFIYTRGRNERVSIIHQGCQRVDGVTEDVMCKSCSGRIGTFSVCQSCAVVACDDSGGPLQAPVLDCENLSPGAVFNLCNPAASQVDGVFGFLGTGFDQCLDDSPGNDVCSQEVGLVIGGDPVLGTTEFALDDGVDPCGDDSFGPGLWYSFVGTGNGVVAATCGGDVLFDTQISVYRGSCDNLACVAFNDDLQREGCSLTDSAASWFAEIDIVYHIRVHGYDTERGEFQISVAEVDLAIQECFAVRDFIESTSTPVSGATCECSDSGTDSQVLSCSNSCEYCNTEGDVCSTWSIGGVFDAEKTRHSSYDEYRYTKGRAEVIRVDENGCTDAGNCEGCSVTVDGNECSSCEIVDCLDRFGNVIGSGKQVDCSNLEAGALFNTCDELNMSGVFQTLNDNEFGECVLEPMEACLSLASSREEQNGDDGTLVCSCNPDENGGVTLACADSTCRFCNTEATTCSNLIFGGVVTGDYGEITNSFQEHIYVEGRNEVVRYEEADDGSCVMTVDGVACASCALKTCSGNRGIAFQGTAVDCSNVEADAVLDDCGEPMKFDGVFEVFSHFEFDRCVGSGSPEDACQTQKSMEEKKGALEGLGTVCECVENPLDGVHTLTCTHSECLFCNLEGTVCAKNVFGSRFGRYGTEMTSLSGFEYVMGGRNEKVVLEQGDGECTFSVDGTDCASCKFVTCPNEVFGLPIFRDIEVDCGEVGSFNGCDEVKIDTGVLEVVSDFEFGTCLREPVLPDGDTRESGGPLPRALFSSVFSWIVVGGML